MDKEISTATLPELAQSINRAQSRIESLLTDAVENAVTAGNALICAKALVLHGEWQKWISDNCQISDRTARAYMRLARELPKLSHAKRQSVAVLPLRDVFAEMATPRSTQTDYPPLDVMVSHLTPNEGKWIINQSTSVVRTRKFTVVIPKERGKNEITYQIVSMHGLSDGTGYIEACKPIYAFGIPRVLWMLGVSTSPLDWGVIDPILELENELAA